jgi:hypothetical protein
VDVCTIIAKNDVAQARVLARSFAAQHPRGHGAVRPHRHAARDDSSVS